MEENSKRRFLRRAGLAGLIGGLTAGLGARAWADRGPGEGPRGRGPMEQPLDPAKMDLRIEHMAKHFAVEIDATPEQAEKLASIAKAAARDLRPMREKLREARKRGLALLAAPSVDRAAIEQLRSEQMQAAEAASRRLTQALADAADVLTPEQRRKAAERIEKRRAWGHGPHGYRRG